MSHISQFSALRQSSRNLPNGERKSTAANKAHTKLGVRNRLGYEIASNRRLAWEIVGNTCKATFGKLAHSNSAKEPLRNKDLPEEGRSGTLA